MANLKLTLNSNPYDVAEINGEEYRLYYDDESLQKYQEQAKRYYKGVQAHLGVLDSIEDSKEEDIQKFVEQNFQVAKDVIDTFLGNGAYEKLYEQSGKSVINLIPVIEMIFEWYQSKSDYAQEKKDYYTKKNKK